MLVQAQEIPEFMKAAFLTVIGFYFGGVVKQKQSQEKDNG